MVDLYNGLQYSQRSVSTVSHLDRSALTATRKLSEELPIVRERCGNKADSIFPVLEIGERRLD